MDLAAGRAAIEVLLQCYADMTCEEVVKLLDEGDFGPCADEMTATGPACADEGP